MVVIKMGKIKKYKRGKFYIFAKSVGGANRQFQALKRHGKKRVSKY